MTGAATQVEPCASLAAGFAAAVREHPDRVALRIGSGKSWTYAALGAETGRVAHALLAVGVGPEARIAVVGGRTAETLIALLGVLAAGCAYCVIDPALPALRRGPILDSLAPAAVILTEPDQEEPAGLACPAIRIDANDAAAVGAPPTGRVGASALAYVLFTSGSTGRPKGVMVEHRSVLNMLASYDRIAPPADALTGTWIAPPAFDVSVWEIFSVLTRGGTLDIPDRRHFAGGDELWHYLCDAGIDSAYVPPGLIASLAAAAERRRGTLGRILVGVEPIPQGLLQRLDAACPGLRIVNGYGPTETTITATLHQFTQAEDPDRRVPIGRPVAGSRIAIVDGDLAPVPDGDTGEILVFGDCLARGYLGGEPGGFVETHGARAYRTGDYGRMLDDGAIEFVGRHDGQVKISGFRVETGDVEAALHAMPGIAGGIVLVAGEGSARRLIAAVEAPDEMSVDAVRGHLADRLPAYAVPSRILTLRALPRTANGKVDTRSLLAAEHGRASCAAAFVAPHTPWQRELAGVWAEILGVGEIGIDDDFHQLGGSSLDAVRIATVLGDRGHAVRAGEIVAARTIRHVTEPPPAAAARLAAAPPGAFPANRAQQGLWAWRQLNPASARTTVVHAIRIDGPIDRGRVEGAMRAIVARHEALRTSFAAPEGALVQRVAASPSWTLSVADIDSEIAVDEEIERWLSHRFDVELLPWTVSLLIGPGFGVLVFAADHLVFDGESADILQRELAAAYDDPSALADGVPGPASLGPLITLPPTRNVELRAWWDHSLDGVADRLMLPEPLSRNAQDGAMRRLRTGVDEPVREAIAAVARAAATTPFVVVLAAFKAFLHARDGNADNGVAVALSRRQALGGTAAIGHFVNLVPVRDQLAGSPMFADYLDQIAAIFTAAVGHGDLPFEDMIANVARPSGTRIAGPARIVLVQQAPTETAVTRDGVRFAAWPELPSNAIYDLAVFVTEGRDLAAGFEWVWGRDATLDRSVEWLAEAFDGFLRAAVTAPETPLSALPALGQTERRLVLAMATPTPTAAEGETLVGLFDAQVMRRPDAVAVDDGATQVSYARLQARAAAIARALPGASDRRPVVIVLDKSVDQLAAMLAVIRSGSAYLPLAPDHAVTRLPDLAVRSRAGACITDRANAASLRLPEGCRTIIVDTISDDGFTEPVREAAMVAPEDLAYVMPTSGSTGPPKLVGVPHRAVVRLVHRNASIPLDESDRTMLIANTSFDAATLEIWGALANGGRVVVPDAATLRDPALLCATIERHGITAAFFTTTLFEQLERGFPQLGGMRQVIVGGEAVPPRLFAAASSVLPRHVLVNGYGPTENTTFSCCYRLDRDPSALRSLPIGAPVSGSGAVVVDAALRLLPPGMPGEILVTGAGLATGYVDDPALTRERFVSLTALDGARAYRTGDLGRLLPEGILEYLGRVDRQLKIRGFRVEPGEVEAALSAHPAVGRCSVFAEELGGIRALVAAVEGDGIDDAALRGWLTERMPAFLIPTRIYVVDRFPMTANGKLDHAALRRHAPVARLPDNRVLSALERHVTGIAIDLLGLPAIGLDDDLFALGANSMAALALAARVGERIGRPVPAHLLYGARTIRSFARSIERAPPAGPRAPQRVLDRAARIRTPPGR